MRYLEQNGFKVTRLARDFEKHRAGRLEQPRARYRRAIFAASRSSMPCAV